MNAAYVVTELAANRQRRRLGIAVDEAKDRELQAAWDRIMRRQQETEREEEEILKRWDEQTAKAQQERAVRREVHHGNRAGWW